MEAEEGAGGASGGGAAGAAAGAGAGAAAVGPPPLVVEYEGAAPPVSVCAEEAGSGSEEGGGSESGEPGSGSEEGDGSESEEPGSGSEEGGSGGSSEGSVGEVELTVDMNDRAAWGSGQGVCFTQRVFPDAIDPDAGLYRDCEHAFNARSVKASGAYSSGRTFFIGALQEPRCRLEALAREIFWFHAKDSGCDHFKSGAEWWTQVVDKDDDIGWHWDKDYDMEDCGVNLCPHLGTVTYFSDIGAPTFVLEKTPNSVMRGFNPSAQQKERKVEISHGFLCWPAVGKHMVFDGRFLHGAPSDLQVGPKPAEGPQMANDPHGSVSFKRKKRKMFGKRTTFLVNIWLDHIPEGARRAPQEMVNKMEQPSLAPETKLGPNEPPQEAFQQPATVKEVIVDDTSFRSRGGGTESTSGKYCWEFQHLGQGIALEARLPQFVFSGRSRPSGAVHINFDPECAPILRSKPLEPAHRRPKSRKR